MFSGAYLEDERNIGHEIINLYKPDQGEKHYIYLVPSGDYATEHSKTEIDGVLLVRGIHANCLEVIAKATGIRRVFNNEQGNIRHWTRLANGAEFEELAAGHKDGNPLSQIQQQKRRNFLDENAYQRRFIQEKNIRYSGVLADKLFDNNPETKHNLSLFITFEADRVQKVKEPFYLVTHEKEAIFGKHYEVIGRERLSGSASATFFSDKEKENYGILRKILFESPQLWGEDVEIFDPAKIQDDETFSFFTILKKEYDELAYSNAFAYFFEKYDILLEALGALVKEKFGMDVQVRKSIINTAVAATKEGKKDTDELPSEKTRKTIYREKKNIDILIADSQTKNIIVIENKIKSGIHGERHDLNGEYIRNQLDKYFEYVESEYPRSDGYCNYYFLFMPDYNAIKPDSFYTEAQKAFKPIYFSELYNSFANCLRQRPELFAGDIYWQGFLNALKKHSSKYDNNFEEIMKRKMKRLVHAQKHLVCDCE